MREASLGYLKSGESEGWDWLVVGWVAFCVIAAALGLAWGGMIGYVTTELG